MVAVSVAFNGVRLHDMGDTDGTTGVGSLGGGAGAGAEPDFVYQGSNSVSRKIGTTLAGFDIDTSGVGGSADMDDPRNNDRGLWFFKVIATNKDALLIDGSPALELRLGPSSAIYATIEVSGNRTYPVKGGWLLGAISATLTSGVNHLSSYGIITGTMTLPPLADYFAIRGGFGSTSKSENVAMDAIDIGMGLTLTGGTSTDPDGTFAAMVAADQGTSGNRWGAITEVDGIIFSLGVQIIGATSYAPGSGVATVFTDSFFTVVFPETFSSAWTGLRFNLDDATTVISLADGSLLGQTPAQIGKFNTQTELSAATDAVGSLTNNLRNRFSLGTQVRTYSNGGTETPGVTNSGTYYVGYPATDAGDITFHTTRLNALTRTSPVALTASTAGNGEVWMITASSTYRSQPRLTFDNIGGVATFTRVLFADFNQIWNEDAGDVTFSDCTFVNLGRQGNDSDDCTFEDCAFIGHNTYNKIDLGTSESPTSMIIHSNPALFSGCSFTPGPSLGGHALDFTVAGTYSFVGNTFSGYPTSGQTVHEFDNTTDVDGTLNEITLPTGHGYVTGDGVVYDRRLTGNTGLAGLTQETTYFVNVVGDVMSLHLNEGDALNDNAPISLTAGTGNQTHALWPADAAIVNSSGGLITLNVTGGGSTPSIRNTLDSTVVINNSVTVSIRGVTWGTPVVVKSLETVGTLTFGDVLFEGFADSLGVASFLLNYQGAFGAGLAVSIDARNAGVCVAAIAEDGGVFTDETAEAANSVVDDMNLLPAAPAVSDAYYFGHDEQFPRLKLNISDANGAGSTITWEYWNGLAWSALAGVVDGTSNFENLGVNIVSWDIPGGWATTTINTQGPLYYVRARITVVGSANQTRARHCNLDTTRYLPFPQTGVARRTVTASGLDVTASWTEDTIGKFTQE